jgi:isoleucyl-tRNA synthetase
VHKETGALHPGTSALLEAVALRVEQGGIEAWQTLEPADLLGADSALYEKNKDTLDVWFDSGTSHATVMGGMNGDLKGSHADRLGWPADMYLEGSDQHRGWFHSSLLSGCMLYGRAPYKSLLTHGFAVDGQGHKMSKSVGNVVAPQKISDTLGAEILRLWVANTDYAGELSISDEILKRVVESYRRIRNTMRFLLSNIADFDGSTDSIAFDKMLEIDRYALVMTAQMQAEVCKHYDAYEFQPAITRIQSFCSEDLGAFYLDILKDRLYTEATTGVMRRSAQTALLHITQTLLKLMAPVLSFTAEEAWQALQTTSLKHLSELEKKTIFTQRYQTQPSLSNEVMLLNKWSRVREIRAVVLHDLEDLRSAGKIGASLQAEIIITATQADYDHLLSLGDQLKFVMIVSKASLELGQTLAVKASPSTAQKCGRCWHYVSDLGVDPQHPDICGRCSSNLTHANH